MRRVPCASSQGASSAHIRAKITSSPQATKASRRRVSSAASNCPPKLEQSCPCLYFGILVLWYSSRSLRTISDAHPFQHESETPLQQMRPLTSLCGHINLSYRPYKIEAVRRFHADTQDRAIMKLQRSPQPLGANLELELFR